MKPSPTGSPALELHRIIRGMHQRNRTVSTAYGTDLGVVESSAMAEIKGDPGLTISDLGEKLALTQVNTTRLVQNMIDQGLVVVSSDAEDRRRKRLKMTQRGSSIFNAAYERAKSTFGAAFERIPARRRDQFVGWMKVLCDGLEAPEAVSLPTDPPIMCEIRRLTRGLGLLSRSVYGKSGMPPLEWQILSQICTTERPIYAADLVSFYGVLPNTMSGILRRMEDAGYITRPKGDQDKRFHSIEAKPAGLKRFLEIERLAENQLKVAMQKIPNEEQNEFVELWRAYAAVELTAEDIVLSSHYSIRRATDEENRSKARLFLLQQRLSQNLVEEIPSLLCDAGSVIYLLRSPAGLNGVAEFSLHPKTRQWILIHLIVDPNQVQESTIENFAHRSLTEFFNVSAADEVVVSQHNCSTSSWNLLQQLSTKRGEERVIDRERAHAVELAANQF